MLRQVKTRNVGPAPVLQLDFAERLNVLTGDNGLGKSFVLDVAWWALTRTWAGGPVWPDPSQYAEAASIDYSIRTSSKDVADSSSFYSPQTREWSQPPGRPPNPPGLVLYSQADGGLSVRDPNRNYWANLQSREYSDPGRPAAFHFTGDTLWKGLHQDDRTLCNGLIQDWVVWQLKRNEAFEALKSVLEVLSPCEAERIDVDAPEAFLVGDAQEYPFIRLPYGRVPVVHASAGMRRVLSLAYALVWSWTEHRRVSEQLKLPTLTDIVFVLDEVEAHLHPQWQRVILPALLKAARSLGLTGIQVLTTTHSPLVLASVETLFDEERDKVFTFELEQGVVDVREQAWAKRGETGNWLVSDVFGLKKARSLEAERAIEAAEAFMRNDFGKLPNDLKDMNSIHRELLRVLADGDAFWPRWLVKTGRVGA